jgi:hypothetical protein
MSYLYTQSDRPNDPLDPREAQLGLLHREVIHMLTILAIPDSPRANRLKAFRLHPRNMNYSQIRIALWGFCARIHSDSGKSVKAFHPLFFKESRTTKIQNEEK